MYLGTSLTEFSLFVCFCLYVPDDGFVEVETRRTNVSDKLFINCCTIILSNDSLFINLGISVFR